MGPNHKPTFAAVVEINTTTKPLHGRRKFVGAITQTLPVLVYIVSPLHKLYEY